MTQNTPVIAIDGPAAVGKGTIATAVANELSFFYLDSGKLYRAVGLWLINAGVDFSEEQVLTAAKPLLDDHDLLVEKIKSVALNTEEVGQAASKIASIGELRNNLNEHMRKLKVANGLVADGRDIGTIVFPNATLKVFLQASLATQEKRFTQRISEQGLESSKIAFHIELFRKRNKRDNSRLIAPVVPAADACVIDTDNLSAEQSVQKIVNLYQSMFVDK